MSEPFIWKDLIVECLLYAAPLPTVHVVHNVRIVC